MKPIERVEARRLRSEEGLALNAIAERLGVTKGSVSRWVRDIELSDAQQAALDAGNPARSRQRTGTRVRQERCRAERVAAQLAGRERARAGSPLHVAGCMLYWAEGAKGRNAACLVNSDPDLMSLFVRFLRIEGGVEDRAMALSINCFLDNGLSLGEIQSWWLERLQLPPTCLRGAVVNQVSTASRHRKHRVLVYGTARVCVYSTALVQGIYGAIQEYAGVAKPEWLDVPG